MADADRDDHFPKGGGTRQFFSRAVGFWTGPDRRVAWFWTGAALALLVANLIVNVGINRRNKWFFDALEAKGGE